MHETDNEHTRHARVYICVPNNNNHITTETTMATIHINYEIIRLLNPRAHSRHIPSPDCLQCTHRAPAHTHTHIHARRASNWKSIQMPSSSVGDVCSSSSAPLSVPYQLCCTPATQTQSVRQLFRALRRCCRKHRVAEPAREQTYSHTASVADARTHTHTHSTTNNS